MIPAASGGVFRRRANWRFSCSLLIILAWLHPTGMIDAATLQARLDAELQEHLAAGRAIYDGERAAGGGGNKGHPGGWGEGVGFDPKGHEHVLWALLPVTREAA